MKGLGMLFQLCGVTEASKYSTSRLDGSKRRNRSSEPELPRFWRSYLSIGASRVVLYIMAALVISLVWLFIAGLSKGKRITLGLSLTVLLLALFVWIDHFTAPKSIVAPRTFAGSALTIPPQNVDPPGNSKGKPKADEKQPTSRNQKLAKPQKDVPATTPPSSLGSKIDYTALGLEAIDDCPVGFTRVVMTNSQFRENMRPLFVMPSRACFVLDGNSYIHNSASVIRTYEPQKP
jgi:hypothetical protein